jgi:hypothetical protein
MQRKGEVIALGVIAILIAIGGRHLLGVLALNKTWGAVLAVLFLVYAVRELRGAYDPSAPDARIEVTKAGAYVCAAVLALWAILAPARWNLGACLVAAEVAVVFDLISIVARGRAVGG